MSAAAVMFPDLEGHWYSVLEDDRRALGLYLRHYSSSKARGSRTPTPLRGNAAKFVGPGASLVLLTAGSDALFVWRKQDYRKDEQIGIECSIFRNEGSTLSSDLIREADALAWSRWPGERHFTFVWDSKVRSVNPGACFKKAGWKVCGRNADGRLTILEILPPTPEQAREQQPIAPARRDHQEGGPTDRDGRAGTGDLAYSSCIRAAGMSGRSGIRHPARSIGAGQGANVPLDSQRPAARPCPTTTTTDTEKALTR